MADLPIAPADLQGIIDTVCSKVKGANHDDAAEAVSVALLEWIEKGDELDLDISRSVNGALVTRAVWRLKTALSRRDARNLSLDAFAEDDVDQAPVELAVSEVDFDSHMALREASDNPTLHGKLEAIRAGGAPIVRPRGAASPAARWPDEVVERVLALRMEALTYAAIAERTGVPQRTIEPWCRREKRLPTMPGWTQGRVVEAIKGFQLEEGRRPGAKDIEGDPRLPCMDTIRKLFGRWSLALKAADIVIEDFCAINRERVWPEQRLATAIRDFLERHGRLPRDEDYHSANGLPSTSHLHRRYGTQRSEAILSLIEAA